MKNHFEIYKNHNLLLKDEHEQGFIQEKIGSESGPFTKTSNLKTDPSQKSATLKRTLHKIQRL